MKKPCSITLNVSALSCGRGIKLFSMTLGIKLGSTSKTRKSQIIVKYEETHSNSHSYAEMRDTKFFFSRDRETLSVQVAGIL